VGAGNFSLHHHDQNGSGAHPASYPMGTRGPFPGGKAAGAWADHLPPSGTEVKNTWSYTSTSPISLHGVVLSYAQAQLYLYNKISLLNINISKSVCLSVCLFLYLQLNIRNSPYFITFQVNPYTCNPKFHSFPLSL
jgi:hypothetical protein